MKITIKPYQSMWVFQFLHEKAWIKAALAHLAPAVEHIGSTAVPGMAAKPVIDILVGLQKEEQLDQTIQPMIKAGYTYVRKYEPLMPYRRFYVRLTDSGERAVPAMIDIGDEITIGEEFKSTTHIHILVKDTLHWTRHIAFRDYLMAHPEVAARYDAHKKNISQQEFKDGIAYNDAKNDFVKKVEAIALQWYNDKNKR